MDNYLFNLRFTAKQLERNSKKCLRQETIEKTKCKRAIQRGNFDGARVHAENAIRHRNQSLQYLQMSARVDAVVARVRGAMSSRSIAHSIGGVSRAIEVAMRSLNLERISQIMDRFEQQFDELDVSTEMVEQTMDNSNNTLVLERPTHELMQQIADEAGLELNLKLPSAIHSKLQLVPSNTGKGGGKVKNKFGKNFKTQMSIVKVPQAITGDGQTNNELGNELIENLKLPTPDNTTLLDVEHIWTNPDIKMNNPKNGPTKFSEDFEDKEAEPKSEPPPPPPITISPPSIDRKVNYLGHKSNETCADTEVGSSSKSGTNTRSGQSIHDEIVMRLAKLRQR